MEAAVLRLGVVSFLNSRPLIEGLGERHDVELQFAVPAALAEMLESHVVDAALVPIIDVIRSAAASHMRLISAERGGSTLACRLCSRSGRGQRAGRTFRPISWNRRVIVASHERRK